MHTLDRDGVLIISGITRKHQVGMDFDLTTTFGVLMQVVLGTLLGNRISGMGRPMLIVVVVDFTGDWL